MRTRARIRSSIHSGFDVSGEVEVRLSVLYVLLKHSGEQSALPYVHALQHVVAMIDVHANTRIEAAGLKHQ